MANPVIKTIKENEWRLMATAVTICTLSLLDESQNCLYTYRLTGGTIPDSVDEGIRILNQSITIRSDLQIDIYVMALNNNGKIRVDNLGAIVLDDLTEAQVSIDYNHHEIHEGNHFFYASYITLGNAAVGDYVLAIGAKPLHFVFSLSSDIAGFSLLTYENVTANNDGTLITATNNNRTINKLSTAVLRYNPTSIVITGAVLLRSQKVGVGGTPSSRVGGSINRSDEVILKANTKYLLRITNLSTSNNDINIGMTWYEQ
jgi:hypothetical protein